MGVSVLIANYNGGDLVLRCLESVFRDAGSLDSEVIVVDNASADGSGEAIAARFPQVRLVRNSENVGFARATNQALRMAAGDILILLNNDAYFLSGALPRLLAFMDAHPEIDVVGPRVLNPDGSVQRSCFRFPTLRDVMLESFFLPRPFQRRDLLSRRQVDGLNDEAPTPVDWVLGACMAVRRSTLDAVGFMDERYFMYSEELDWCFTMHKAGKRVYYWPEPTVVHYGQQGQESRRIRPDILARGFESRYAYFEKQYGPGYARWVRLVSVIGMLLRLVAICPATIFGNRAEARRRARAYLAVLRTSCASVPGRIQRRDVPDSR